MKVFQKVTTVYVSEEDRIRIAGAVEDGSVAILWLSLRLLQRLIPPLTSWLETSNVHVAGPTQMVQSFQQQAARASLVKQAPVEAEPQSETWTVTAVDYTNNPTTMQLTFKGMGGQSVALALQSDAMRQWLDIVHQAYVQAEWPLDKWPGWISANIPVTAPETMVRH